MKELLYSYELCDRAIQSPIVLEDIYSMVGSRHTFPQDPSVLCILRFYLCQKGAAEIMSMIHTYGRFSLFSEIRRMLLEFGVPKNSEIQLFIKGDKLPIIQDKPIQNDRKVMN